VLEGFFKPGVRSNLGASYSYLLAPSAGVVFVGTIRDADPGKGNVGGTRYHSIRYNRNPLPGIAVSRLNPVRERTGGTPLLLRNWVPVRDETPE
jgi:hypothetical protein